MTDLDNTFIQGQSTDEKDPNSNADTTSGNKVEDAIVAAKDKLPDITPTPPSFHNQANAHELKSRLNWGEPALTIVDVREREAFNDCRILGAINMPVDSLPELAESTLQPQRDIYVYGETDADTASAAQVLRQSQFQHVAELKGGLAAWREINGSIEGTATNENPGADAYNLGSRLQAFSEEKAKENRMKS